MELIRRFLEIAIPHPFVLAAPGGTGARLAVERELRKRGWPQALSPADADMLILCGSHDRVLDEAIERVWAQLPAPRTRMRIASPGEAGECLDRARGALNDLEGLRRDAAARDSAPAADVPGETGESVGMAGDHGQMSGHRMDQGSGHDEPAAPSHDDTGMDMGGMDLPGGVPMADRGEDRDGLKLDQLHVALGPVLPDWPVGLVVRLVLQGDVAQSAEVSTIGSGRGASYWAAASAGEDPGVGRVRAAAAADSLQRFLSVAGWRSAALTSRWLRDELLVPGASDPVNPRFVRWLRRLSRSRVLRWSTNGLGLIDGTAPQTLRGDVTNRWLGWLGEIAAVIEPRDEPIRRDGALGSERAEAAAAAMSLLPTLLTGQDLAAVRLIVASIDPDVEAFQAQLVGRLHA